MQSIAFWPCHLNHLRLKNDDKTKIIAVDTCVLWMTFYSVIKISVDSGGTVSCFKATHYSTPDNAQQFVFYLIHDS